MKPFKYSKDVPFFQLLVPNLDTTRFSFLLETCLDVDKSLLLTGGTGVGKSVIITDYLARSQEPRGLVNIILNFSAQTPAKDTQLLIESKLEKKRKTQVRRAAQQEDCALRGRRQYARARNLRRATSQSSCYVSTRTSAASTTARSSSGRTSRIPRWCARARPPGGRQAVTRPVLPPLQHAERAAAKRRER